MNSNKRQILVIVEGSKTDYNLMTHLLNVYGISQDHNMVAYDTNIYSLYNVVFATDDPDSIDILQLLKEHEKDSKKKRIFNQRYTDILLIFDFDPQDPNFSPQKILEMVNFFVESSDMGKLYLNYPMVEAFYHMKSIPDDDYNTYSVSMEELKKHLYKARVSKENRNHDYRKFDANKFECDIVIKQNIIKANYIIESEKTADNILPQAIDILKVQLKNMKDNGYIAVLSTCVFYIFDYNPKLLNG